MKIEQRMLLIYKNIFKIHFGKLNLSNQFLISITKYFSKSKSYNFGKNYIFFLDFKYYVYKV